MLSFEGIQKMLSPIRRRINFLITKAIVNIIKDTGGFQIIQATIQDGEIQDGVPRIQEYGFTSHPVKGAQAVIACVNGYRNQGIIIKVDDSRYRKKNLSEGEVAIYCKDGGFVLLKPNGEIHISSDDIKLGDGIAHKALVNDLFKEIFNSHTHPAPGGATSAPVVPMTDLQLTSKTKAE